MADETVDTLDAQLEALLNPDAPASADGKDTTSKPATKPGEVASPPPAATTEDLLEEALKGIDEEKPEDEPAKPALSDEQAAIIAAVPSAEIATQLYAVAENYNNFTSAFESGNYDAVQAMFENWNPSAFEGFLDHIYAKRVASGEWVDRFIAEQEGKGKEHQGMKAIQKEIASLKAQLNQKEQGNQSQQAEQAQKQSYEAYTKHINGLFDQINFSAADRKWVTADLNERVRSDPKVLAELKSGKTTAANKLFKDAVREYVNRDKVTAATTEKKIEAQSQKKLPIGGGGASQESPLSDDIRQVPKGQEDSWMDQQLSKLGKKVGLIK